MLSAGTGRTVYIYTQIITIDINIHIFYLRKDSNSNGRSVNTTLAFCRRYPLDTMRSAFKL